MCVYALVYVCICIISIHSMNVLFFFGIRNELGLLISVPSIGDAKSNSKPPSNSSNEIYATSSSCPLVQNSNFVLCDHKLGVSFECISAVANYALGKFVQLHSI